ncbi:MAG: T9SS type A sorting domain-containing protein, partial [Flavobacteriales bacterium]|nr:T9SS type A sorting domain-containing protein [Flavobacteriales bacterium]
NAIPLQCSYAVVALPNMIDALAIPQVPAAEVCVDVCGLVHAVGQGCGTSYTWDFGDGAVLTGPIGQPVPFGFDNGVTYNTYSAPSHSYANNGTYTIDFYIDGVLIESEVVVIDYLHFANVVTTDDCGTSCSGSAQINTVSGTPPLTFIWDAGTGNQTTNPAINLCDGAYTGTVTDADGCIVTATATIVDAPVPAAPIYVSPVQICSNILPVIFPCPDNYTSGTNITVYNAMGSPVFPSQPCPVTFTGTLPVAGSYNVFVEVTDGCGVVSAQTSVTVIITDPPLAPAAPSFTYCEGETVFSNLAMVDFIPVGAVTTWYDDAALTNVVGTGVSIPVPATVPNPAVTGTYSFWVTNTFNGCEGAATQVDIVVTPGPVFDIGNDFTVCAGTTPTVNLTGCIIGAIGQHNYIWSGDFGILPFPTPCNLTEYPTTTSTYCLEIQDNFSGCSATDCMTVTFDPTCCTGGGMTASATVNDAQCEGICNGSATVLVSLGTAPFTFLWDDPSGQTTATAIGLCAGSYIVNVMDAGGFNTTVNVEVENTTTLVLASTSTTATCSGAGSLPNGTAYVNAISISVAPYTFLWEDGQVTQTAVGLYAGIYNVSVTDGSGCTNSTQVEVLTNLQVNSVITPNDCGSLYGGAPCNGAATAVVTGGSGNYSYAWSVPGFPTTATITGLCSAGPLLVTDNITGCQTNVNVGIGFVGGDISISTTPADCSGACNGAMTVSITGTFATPVTYNWSNGGTGPTQAGLCAGTFLFISATSADGCFLLFGETIITEPVVISITNPVIESCPSSCDGSATATIIGGGSSPYTFIWTSGETTQTASGLCAGTNTVSVTGAGGCIGIQTVEIGSIADAGLDIGIGHPASCGSPNYSIIGAPAIPCATYSWSPSTAIVGPTNIAQPTIVATGTDYTYTVLVTLGSCTMTDAMNVFNVHCRMESEGDENADQKEEVTKNENSFDAFDHGFVGNFYPNPAKNNAVFVYNLLNTDGATFEIMTILGEHVAMYQLQNDNGKIELDFSHFSSGIYIYQVVTEKGIIGLERFIIQK